MHSTSRVPCSAVMRRSRKLSPSRRVGVASPRGDSASVAPVSRRGPPQPQRPTAAAAAAVVV